MWKEVNILSTNFSAKHMPSASLNQHLLYLQKQQQNKHSDQIPRGGIQLYIEVDVRVKWFNVSYML